MSRLAIGLFCSLVVTGFSTTEAAEPHREWIQFMKGSWTYAYEKLDIKGEVKYTSAAKGHALVARGIEGDDAWVELIAWRPDIKKMVFSGHGAKNDNYWHTECRDVTRDRIAGETYGVLPDGRPCKGKVVIERAGDDSFVVVLKVRAGDDEVEDTGKFTRVKK